MTLAITSAAGEYTVPPSLILLMLGPGLVQFTASPWTCSDGNIAILGISTALRPADFMRYR